MRIEVAGAQITDSVAEVLDSWQNDGGMADIFIDALDTLTRSVILDLSGSDEERDAVTLSRLRALQLMRRDILTLSRPADADLPENDTPTAQF